MFRIININTEYDKVNYRHPVVIYELTHKLLDYPAIWLSNFTNDNTATKYAKTICNFCNYLGKRKNFEYTTENLLVFWRHATLRDIRSWKSFRIQAKFRANSAKPALNTIDKDALVVAKFLCWVKNNHSTDIPFEISADVTKRNLRIGNIQTVSSVADTHPGPSLTVSAVPLDDDYPIEGLARRTQIIKPMYLSDAAIKQLINAFPDEVYKYICLTGVMTGLRPFETLRVPYYKIQADGTIFSSCPSDIQRLISAGENEIRLHVLGKFDKLRSVRFCTRSWQMLLLKWTPIYLKRKKLYERRYGTELSAKILWLDKNGNPIYTSISDTQLSRKSLAKLQSAFYYISKKRRENPLSKAMGREMTYYMLRHTFATNYILNMMEARRERDINSYIEDHSLRYDLAQQMGHSEVDTTFRYYVDNAIAIIKSREQGMNDIFPNMEDLLNRR